MSLSIQHPSPPELRPVRVLPRECEGSVVLEPEDLVLLVVVEAPVSTQSASSLSAIAVSNIASAPRRLHSEAEKEPPTFLWGLKGATRRVYGR